jgi:hypothetical protein
MSVVYKRTIKKTVEKAAHIPVTVNMSVFLVSGSTKSGSTPVGGEMAPLVSRS